MRYAETGFNLEVDLARGNIERVPTDPKDTELLLGGLGTNAKMSELSAAMGLSMLEQLGYVLSPG